jgi:predicted ATPase/DNA-binding XRE family transcriptional regulator
MRQFMSGDAGQEICGVSHWSVVLRGLRQAAGVTQEGWAAWLGYGRRTVQRWERGDTVPDAPATAAILELCCERALFRTYRQGVLAGLTVTSDLLQDLLTEARQVGNGHCAPAERISRTAHNLPAELTSFIGRELEHIEVSRRLRRARLLTIVGVGGVGKTRLALRVARDQLDRYADGVWLIELDSLSEPELVAGAVARAVGVREQAGVDVVEMLAEALVAREILLVLDNCEHLAAACAELVERLLRACPNLRVLATSREPLGVPGETIWRLAPLSVVPVDRDLPFSTLAGTEGVRLFADRAGAIVPDFHLVQEDIAAVAQISWQLDGIPLAIELAAARVAILSPEEIADRLDDRFRLLVTGLRTAPTRQQTLRTTLDWSYELLNDRERHALECLSVFPGSFALPAVTAILTIGQDVRIDRGEVDVVASLVAKSLVQVVDSERNETRYRLLETVRAYGLERLEARGQAHATRRRFALWARAFVEEAESRVHGIDQSHWLRRIARELPNLEGALVWAVENGEVDLALGLVGAQAWYWFHAIHGTAVRGRLWLERALSLPGSGEVPHVRLKALAGIALLSMTQGDRADAWAWIKEELALAEEIQDDAGLLAARGGIAQYLLMTGAFEEAGRVAEESLDLARRLDETWVTVILLSNRAYGALHRGDALRARQCFMAGAGLARDKGDTWSLAMALGQLGDLERAQGAHDRAGSLYQESLALNETLGLGGRSPSLLHNLGYVAVAQGKTPDAREYFTQALLQFQSRGDRRGVAECVIGLAAAAAAEGEPETAAPLFGAGQAALEALGTQLWPSNRPDYDHWVARTRAGLPASVFETLWSDGRRISLDAAMARALSRPV